MLSKLGYGTDPMVSCLGDPLAILDLEEADPAEAVPVSGLRRGSANAACDDGDDEGLRRRSRSRRRVSLTSQFHASNSIFLRRRQIQTLHEFPNSDEEYLHCLDCKQAHCNAHLSASALFRTCVNGLRANSSSQAEAARGQSG